MENHSKYAESIYFKDNQELLVNLYIPSRLHWKEKGLKLTLDTYFPESDTVTVRMDEIGSYTGTLLFRYPDWVSGDAVVRINGEPAQTEAHKGSYIRLLDSVKSGDVITLVFTRNLYIDYAKDEPHFGSVMYGPILLAGGLGTDDMPEDRVIDNRACRESLPAKNIPMLVGPLTDLDSWIQCSSQHPLRFTVKNGGGQQGVGLVPYFQMHHQRHTVYWKLYSPDEFVYRTRSLTDEVKIGDETDAFKIGPTLPLVVHLHSLL